MKINFELYRVFYYAATLLNFSEAAEQLCISQSAVSQSIKQLEEQLNTKLFLRTKKKVALTPNGENLFSYIEKAFNLIQAGERSMESLISEKKGELKLAASDTICKYYLLPFFKEYNEKYPEIKLKIINRPSPICIDMVKKGTIDLAVVNLPEKHEDKTLNIKIIKEIKDVFIAGNNFPELRNGTFSIHELKKYPLLLLEKNSTTRSFFEKLMIKEGLNFEPEIELESIDLLIELTKIGLGISFIMLDAIQKELDNDEVFIINIKEKTVGRQLGLITNRELPLSCPAEKFSKLFA